MAFHTKRAARLGALLVALLAALFSMVATTAGAEDAEPDLAKGAELYQLCAQCHGEQGQGNKIFLAPAIAGLDEWYVVMQLNEFRGGYRGQHFDDIAGMRMRPMSLTLAGEEEIRDVSAYVAQMEKQVPEVTLTGDAKAGQTLYTICAACHGPEGKGIQPMKAPGLVDLNDWYLVEQLMKFKMGIRGTRPGDPYGVLMGPNSPMAMTLKTDQSVRDVVAYIMSLRK